MLTIRELNPEAFSGEYEEEQNLLHQLAGEGITIRQCQADLDKEKRKVEPQYARLARIYIKQLREIFWNGTGGYKQEAQGLIEELEMLQTQPLSALDSPFAYVGNGPTDYQEVDSYTGVPLDSITRDEEAQALGGRTAPKIPDHGDPLAVRIAEASRELGYNEAQIQFILAANSGNDFSGEETSVYEDRGITSVPIQQGEEQDLRVRLNQLMELRENGRSYTKAIQDFRTQFFLEMDATKPKTNWKKLFRRRFNASSVREDFIAWLNTAAKDFEPQHIALMFLSMQNDDWGMSYNDSKLITIPWEWQHEMLPGDAQVMGFGTLWDFIEMFGEDILEQSLDGGGIEFGEDEAKINKTADIFTEQILETFDDDPDKAWLSKAYARGVFNAAGNNLHEAGMAAWRLKKSPSGASAYNYVMISSKPIKDLTEEERKDLNRRAWRAFYNAGKIVSTNSRGVNILVEYSGKQQFVPWRLAWWKIKHHEIMISHDDINRLKRINNDW